MTTESQNPRELSANQRALIALREMRIKLDALENAKTEPIAIIGMGCRFPGGVSTPEEYWQLLQDGIDTVKPIPDDRWDLDAYFDADSGSPGKIHVAHASALDSVDQFDPEFFGITPREARSMDPQQRLLLEVTWEALERSGHAPSQLFGTKTGIYIGISTNDYGMAMNKADPATLDALYTGHRQCLLHCLRKGVLRFGTARSEPRDRHRLFFVARRRASGVSGLACRQVRACGSRWS